MIQLIDSVFHTQSEAGTVRTKSLGMNNNREKNKYTRVPIMNRIEKSL